MLNLLIVISYAINNLKSSGKKIIITGYIMNVFGYVINCPSKMFGFSFFSASSYLTKWGVAKRRWWNSDVEGAEPRDKKIILAETRIKRKFWLITEIIASSDFFLNSDWFREVQLFLNCSVNDKCNYCTLLFLSQSTFVLFSRRYRSFDCLIDKKKTMQL